MMLAQPITFTYPKDNTCTVHIDFKGNEYLIQWNGDWRQLPDLTHFPLVTDATITRLEHSPSVSGIWATSEVLKFGADAHVRALSSCKDGFPICKVAIDTRQRLLLRDEFSILSHLVSQDAPVVRIYPQPLIDEDGIFGFRMERLFEINTETAAEYISEIENAINTIHKCGIVLYDISPSNIMLDQHGRITIIDFGRAGYIGESIPSCKAIGVKPTVELFSVDADQLALDRTIEVLTRKGLLENKDYSAVWH